MTTQAPSPPELGIERLLLVVTGSISAADSPFWVRWLRSAYPQLSLQVVVTPTAAGFVSTAALASASGGEVVADRWPDNGRALHVEWAAWAHAIVVYPATLDYLSRFSHGSGGSPSLLAAQCSTAPVVLAPALPPGGADSHAFRTVLELVAPRDNVGIAPTAVGTSATTGELNQGAVTLLPDVLRLVEQRRRDLAADPVAPAGFGTGLLHTEVVEHAPGRFRWSRRPGPLAPTPFVGSAELLHPALATAGDDSCAVSVGSGAGGGSGDRVYAAPGPLSLAGALLGGALADPRHAVGLTRTARAVGRCLRDIHALPVVPTTSPVPTRGMHRLGEWLGGRARTSAALHAATRVQATLGRTRWDRLMEWHHSVVHDPERVLLHGAPGLGAVAVDAGFAAPVLLTGEDLSAGPWYHDVGWMLGEITELTALNRGTADPEAWSGLAAAFLEGYGAEPDCRYDRMAVLRIALHLHDYLAYTRWVDDPCAVYSGLLSVLVDGCTEVGA